MQQLTDASITDGMVQLTWAGIEDNKLVLSHPKWVERGDETLGKPTHFENRAGNF